MVVSINIRFNWQFIFLMTKLISDNLFVIRNFMFKNVISSIVILGTSLHVL